MVEIITIQNINTVEELFMEKLTTSDYILDYIDWGQATVSRSTSQYVNQIGITVIGTIYKSRNIDLSGFIIADSEQEMTNRKTKLNNFFIPTYEYVLKYKGYKINIKIDSSVRYTNTEERNNNEVICRFKVSGICPYPLFSLNNDLNIKVGKYVGFFHFPFHITEEEPIVFAIEAAGETRKRIIKNIGQIPIGMKIIFKATDNSVMNPVLYNYTTGEYFKIQKQVFGNETIEINTNSGAKSIVGGIGSERTNYFRYMAEGSSWIILQPGDNIIGYSADNGIDILEVKLEISPRFVEVQECF